MRPAYTWKSENVVLVELGNDEYIVQIVKDEGDIRAVVMAINGHDVYEVLDLYLDPRWVYPAFGFWEDHLEDAILKALPNFEERSVEFLSEE